MIARAILHQLLHTVKATQDIFAVECYLSRKLRIKGDGVG
jgi:hypothetical protein